jgi:hypothetical protein
MSRAARRDGVGMVLCIMREDWDGYWKLAARYPGLGDEQTRLLVNQLAALVALRLSENDLEGFARHMAGKGDGS